MSDLAPLPRHAHHDTLDRPSWLRAHIAAVALTLGTLLTLFALFAIRR